MSRCLPRRDDTFRPGLEPTALLAILFAAALGIAITSSPADRVGGVASILVCLFVVLAVISTTRLRLQLLIECAVVGALGVSVAFLATGPLRGPGSDFVVSHFPRIVWDHQFIISPNTLAYLAAPVVPSAAAFAGNPEFGRTKRLGFALVALAVSLLVVMTGARVAIAAVGASVVLGMVLWAPSRRRMLIALLATVAVVAFLLTTPEAIRDLQARVDIWVAVLAVGGDVFGSFGALARTQNSSVPLVVGGSLPLSAHNIFVQTYIDFGLIGVAALVAAAVTSGRAAWQLVQSSTWTERTIGVATLSALSAILITGLGESVLTTALSVGTDVASVMSPIPVLVLAAPLHVRRGISSPRFPRADRKRGHIAQDATRTRVK